MSIQVFFNKPVRPFGIEQLLSEIKGARKRVVIASAWFTDTRAAQALIDSPAPQKTVVLNAADTNRGSKQAYEMLKNYFAQVLEPEYKDGWGEISNHFNKIFIVGSGDWKEGVMHHKFVLVDDDIVWVGSYNLTFQAEKNYETILRIQDQTVCQSFWSEVGELCNEWLLYEENSQYNRTNNAFRCMLCQKLFPNSDAGHEDTNGIICVQCYR